MKLFQKLIRDKMPEILAKEGKEMKLRAALLRGIKQNSSEAEYPPSLACGDLRKGYSPRLHPRSKLRGIRRRRIKTRILNDDKEYGEWLRRKLLEEVQEMAEKPYDRVFHVERLAYLEELIGIIAELKNISPDEIIKTKEKIIAERGSFKKRLLLEP